MVYPPAFGSPQAVGRVAALRLLLHGRPARWPCSRRCSACWRGFATAFTGPIRRWPCCACASVEARPGLCFKPWAGRGQGWTVAEQVVLLRKLSGVGRHSGAHLQGAEARVLARLRAGGGGVRDCGASAAVPGFHGRAADVLRKLPGGV